MNKVIQGQQQDHQGNIYNLFAIYDATGNKSYSREKVETIETKEVKFDLSTAGGHVWYLTNKTMRNVGCHKSDCHVCITYPPMVQMPTPQTVN